MELKYKVSINSSYFVKNTLILVLMSPACPTNSPHYQDLFVLFTGFFSIDLLQNALAIDIASH